MALLEEIMAHNPRFVADRGRPLTKRPARRVALFTCMDTRLVEFLEPAMGIQRGDAMVIKNAGNTLLDPQGGVVRSLVVAIFALGCGEVCVVGHRDCGMAQVDGAALRAAMLARGVPAEALAALSPTLHDWLGAFRDPEGNVRRVVDELRRPSRRSMIHRGAALPHAGSGCKRPNQCHIQRIGHAAKVAHLPPRKRP